MAREVKVFRIAGYMNLYRVGERRKFVVEVPAIKLEHAIERVLSELGSRHKLKRSHIEIIEAREIQESEISKPHVASLLNLDRVVA
ncbi:MAG: 50S ribosomal protein L18Ae [Thermofilaceae archaeon]